MESVEMSKDMPDVSSRTVLASKISVPPLLQGDILRSRLLTRLDQGVKHKLTIIAAPAGFGKTKLAARWLRSRSKQLGYRWKPGTAILSVSHPMTYQIRHNIAGCYSILQATKVVLEISLIEMQQTPCSLRRFPSRKALS